MLHGLTSQSLDLAVNFSNLLRGGVSQDDGHLQHQIRRFRLDLIVSEILHQTLEERLDDGLFRRDIGPLAGGLHESCGPIGRLKEGLSAELVVLVVRQQLTESTEGDALSGGHGVLTGPFTGVDQAERSVDVSRDGAGLVAVRGELVDGLGNGGLDEKVVGVSGQGVSGVGGRVDDVVLVR